MSNTLVEDRVARLFIQPDSNRFGIALTQELESKSWEFFDAGVAWVRRSGTRHLVPALAAFLKRGGRVRISVGIDIHGTSAEGLTDLLDLKKAGDAATFVYHNVKGGTFHPKLYLFRGSDSACLMVGSNNLTESGLYTNVEAGLEVRTAHDDDVIVDAKAALSAWSDPSQKLALELDTVLLARLVKDGHAPKEASMASGRNKAGAASAGPPLSDIFGGTPYQPPPAAIPAVGPGATTAAKSQAKGIPPFTTGEEGNGRVLLMRARKASVRDRPTQMQLPRRVVNTDFFRGAQRVVSGHDGIAHGIIRASARGAPNTIKLEIPEMRTFKDPVLRLEKTSGGIVYLAFDASSAGGRLIHQKLLHGFSAAPPQTFQTIPNRATATWWRFI